MATGNGRDWDARYAGDTYVFGEEPNVFLASKAELLKPGMKALAVADGEGRNGVWLASQGLDVLSIDGSPVAQEKAKKLAAARGVSMMIEHCDLSAWEFPEAAFDLVAAIYIQFAGPEFRDQLFEHFRKTLKPGGLLLLTGYRPEQLAYGTGGPRMIENLYTEDMLRLAFTDFEILELESQDALVDEGPGHSGMSALVNLVARKPH
jgi:SAM-dependent methyltransferase